MMSPNALMWTRIAAGIFALLALNIGYGIWSQRKKTRAGQTWPVTPGEIIASEIIESPIHRSDDASDCTVKLRYRYKVGTEEYQGDRLHFGYPNRVTRQEAEELTGTYPVAAKVHVHFDPQRPAEAVLEPRDTGGMTAMVVFLIVFSLVASVLIAHGIAGKVLSTNAGAPLFAFLMPLAAMGFGFALIFSYWTLRRDRLASRHWPTTRGRVTHSEVVSEIIEDKDDKGNVTSRERFRVALQFSYRVAGRDYHSTHWNWGWTAMHIVRAAAGAVAAQYPSGRAVTVYYDPTEPATAVLDPANKSGVAAPLFGGIALILGGAVFLWVCTLLRATW
jgi:hypothetical protein